MFAGDVGHPARRSWTVIGDSVNVAARLAAAAARRSRCSSDRPSRRPPGHLFDTSSLGALTVKGRRGAVAAARWTSAAGALPQAVCRRRRPSSGARRAATLAEAWERGPRRSGRAIEVVGEAGMGKSRLLAELCDRSPSGALGPKVITVVQPDHYRASVPYATSADMLRVVAGIGADASPRKRARPWSGGRGRARARAAPVAAADRRRRRGGGRAHRGRRSPRPGVGAEPAPRRGRRTAAGGAAGTVALVVEDLQRVDEATRELLADGRRGCVEPAWLVCVTRRPDAAGSRRRPSRPRSSSSVRSRHGRRPAIGARRRRARSRVRRRRSPACVGAAGGNALFLEQLAAHALGDDDDVPDTVERVVAARIDTLAPIDRRLLRDVSVVGRDGAAGARRRAARRPGAGAPRRWQPLRAFVEVEAAAGAVPQRPGAGGRVPRPAVPAAPIAARRHGRLVRQDGRSRTGSRRRHVRRARRPPARGGRRRAGLAGGRRRRPAGRSPRRPGRRRRRVPPGPSPRDPGAGPRERPTSRRCTRSTGRCATASGASTGRWSRMPRRPGCGPTRSPGPGCAAGGRPSSSRRASSAGRWRGGPGACGCSRELPGSKRARRSCPARPRPGRDPLTTRVGAGRASCGRSGRWPTPCSRRRRPPARGRVPPPRDGPQHARRRAGTPATEPRRSSSSRRSAIARASATRSSTAASPPTTRAAWTEARAHYERAAEVIATTGNVTQAAVIAANTAFLLDRPRGGGAGRASSPPTPGGRSGPAATRCSSATSTGCRAGSPSGTGDHDGARVHLAAARERFEAYGSRQMVLDCDVAEVEHMLARRSQRRGGGRGRPPRRA